MNDRIKREASEALKAGYDGVLGLINRGGQIRPYLFRTEEELEYLITDSKFNLSKSYQLMFRKRIESVISWSSLVKILRVMLKKNPDLKLAVVVRGCDARALNELEKLGEITTENLRYIGIICSPEQAAECNCDKPFYDTSKCTGCWKCLEACPQNAIERVNVCPILAQSEYNEEMDYRKAIYIPYAQAVPLKASRDASNCLKLRNVMDCKGCKNVCQAEAILDEDEEKIEEIEVGSVVLSSGFSPYNPENLDIFGYGRLPNVVTSMQFERILSPSGPYGGHLVRPSDQAEAKKIAWLQCVGSRDINRCANSYCSSVCCMYAIKEAVIAKEHAGSDLDCAIFFMDMRTHGKDFEKYYNDARENQGVRFLRSRVHSIVQAKGSDELELSFVDEQGEMHTELFDMAVLSVGLEIPPEMVDLSKTLQLELTDGNFCKTSTFQPVATSRDGIYVAGALQGPKDIPQSVVDASAAAGSVGEDLSSVRFSQTKAQEPVPEVDVRGEQPKIGVFVCNCGSNIAGVVDVPAVRDYAASLPFVEYVTDNLYTCSQDTQENMTEIIKEKNLNRVVVAACTPKTHEPLFQETLMNAGLNKYLFEMVNIRNQDSWVHRFNPDLATEKAKELVRMGVMKSALKEPLQESELDVTQSALVVGGGISGMTSALSLARQGYETHLIERDAHLGGQARYLYKTWKGEDIQERLANLIQQVENTKNLHCHLNTHLVDSEGFVGNFKTVLSNGKKEETIEHGVVILATGGAEHQPKEYRFGKDSRIKTHLQLDKMFINNDPALQKIGSAIFIQCVGSREPERPYCSKVCCTHSIESAMEIKRQNPKANVYILYRDIRTYGEREDLYKQARKAGVIFIRFDLENKPEVIKKKKNLYVRVRDHVTGYPLEIKTDLLTLATAIIPYKDEKLAQFFKVPLNEDGFFVERHAKLGPSEFAMDGVYLCGLAHYPKPIDESVAQGQAAAAKAVSLLAQQKIFSSGEISVVNPAYCSGCGVCVSICPYSAPTMLEEGPNAGKAEINPALCKGCGLCMAACRSGAISLKGSNTRQIYSMIEAI